MPLMRIYFLDEQDRIYGADWLECEHEDDARRLAELRLPEHPGVEVWDGSRRIARVAREPKADG